MTLKTYANYGGFKAPGDEPMPNLKKAENLYIYHKKHTEECVYKHYAALSKAEIDKFIELFIADREDIDKRLDLALHLALFSYACGDKLPQQFYDYLLDNEIYYYGELYLRAEEAVAKKLIAVFEDAEASEITINHLLCALSAIPCQTTKKFFQKSSVKPLPEWTKKLHILPIKYAEISGWHLNEHGEIEKLYSDDVVAFMRCKKGNDSPVFPVKPLQEVCGYCGQPLTLVFDGEKKLASCLHCACYETVFVRQEGERVYWHPKNEPSDFLKDHPEYMQNEEELTASFEYAVAPTKEKRRPTYTAHQFVQIVRTQIGGMPTTVNGVYYPKCPDCGRTMRFVAQLDMEDIEEYEEGLFYFFSCDTCGVHGTNYDQT